MIILEENFKWHLEAFASELFIFSLSWYLSQNPSPYFHGFWHLSQIRPNFLCVGPVVRIQALSQCCSRDKFIWVKTRRRSTWSWKDQDHENTVL